MAISIEQLTQAALSLPSEARARLADQLVESLDTDLDNELLPAWTTEAARRREELRDGSVQPIPGSEALHRVRDILTR